MKIGVIGCGDIFRKAYVPGLRHYAGTELAAVADLDPERAQAAASTFGIPRALTVDQLLADPGIGLVANLTTPQAHVPVNLAALAAGKHVYAEKPLGLSIAETRPMLALARRRKLRIGSAPDTFLGQGHQLARALVDEGAIGVPIGGVMHMACPGHESWHPAPDFYYLPGGGPLLDMGPYYLTAMVNLLGPVATVGGASGRARRERLITSQPRHGTRIPVEVDTHIAGVLCFEQGAIVSLLMSFDVVGHHLPMLELYGTEGTLAMPDPNGFAGPVGLKRGQGDWQDQPMRHAEGRRGAGLADMVQAIATGQPHRASGDLAFHVLEVMEKLLASCRSGRTQTISSRVGRPEPVSSELLLPR